ncbi:MAG: M15 family metallopeptidase [Pyrinomonadaceae bacterium]
MSMRLFGDDVVEFQRLLKSAGLLKGKVDGVWGAATDAAATAFENFYKAIKASGGSFDARSESCIITLVPKAQELARQSLTLIRKSGIDARIISGTRSYAEQDKLFKKGRFGNAGPRVTNARGGQSNHNFGIAWDIGIFDAKGKYLGDSPLYRKAGAIVEASKILAAGVEWGGEWSSFPDVSHYQVRSGLALAEIRRRFEAGEVIV